MCVKTLSGQIYSEGWRMATFPLKTRLSRLLTGYSRVLARLVTGLLFSLSWQLNTNNSMDDVLGFIVCAQGGVQDMTGVINDHALCLA